MVSSRFLTDSFNPVFSIVAPKAKTIFHKKFENYYWPLKGV